MSNKIQRQPGISVSELEADIAYFDARLSLFGSGPESSYQHAQIKAYRALGSLLSSRLSRLGGNETPLPEGDMGRIEVEEILSGEEEDQGVDEESG